MRFSSSIVALFAAALSATPPTPIFAAVARSEAAAADRGYAWVSSGSAVVDQNFYFLTLLSQVSEYRDAVTQSVRLKAIVAARDVRVSSLLADCAAQDARCRIQALLWEPHEIVAIGDVLAADLKLGTIAQRHLRPSGAFARDAAKSDPDMIRAAWSDAAGAMNRISRVYGLGEAPRYPEIDAGDFNPVDAGFGRLISEAMDMATLGTAKDAPFFTGALQFATTLLYLNERELVRRSTALETSENAAAAMRIAKLDWSNYPYGAILVLGNGPNAPYKQLGNFGKLRTMRAAQLYFEYKAPVIIVSGGAVHPAHTEVIEAIGMKRELIERYGVPADSILIDPAARHTTTNFRNAARLIFRYGVPMERASVVTSSQSHITSVIAAEFRGRLQTELGYQPVDRLHKLSPYEAEFRPLPIAMHRDAMDPLDP